MMLSLMVGVYSKQAHQRLRSMLTGALHARHVTKSYGARL